MARKHIGRLSWGGVIALCAILLLTPEARSQITIKRKTYVISGKVGEAGVTMQGFSVTPAPITDENGVYSVEVVHGWSGKVTPVKLGFVFTPNERSYQNVTAPQTDQNYEAKLLSYTISGTTGQPGVRLTGFPQEVISDESGRYSVVVDFGWGGMVTPEKVGFRFEPSSQLYSQVKENKTDNYAAHKLTFKISGSAGAKGVVLEGLPGNPTTDAQGLYSVEVPWGFSGTATPKKEGHEFDPPSREYSILDGHRTDENYLAYVFKYKISGTAGMPGVTMKGLPDDPVTDANGYYEAVVEHGSTVKVTPDRPGFTFEPPSREYTKVVADQGSQDYNPSPILLTISGNTGIGEVVLEGLPGDPTSDNRGAFSVKVDYGWSGSVAPKKEGYYFDPPNPVYSSVTQNQTQSFRAQPITFKISGHTGVGGVILQGLPGSPTSAADGSYSIEVKYKFTGKVTPKKPGFEFEPATREYSELLAPMLAEDYNARIVHYTISGRITADGGKPVTDVILLADPDVGSIMTDANGDFQLEVAHAWRGKITPDSPGYTFKPPFKSFDAVSQNIPNQTFVATIKMLSIVDAVKAGDEPLADVLVTAEPGGYKATTGRDGKFTLKVPFGWSGTLKFEKPGFDIEADPQTYSFTDVKENIDRVAPKPAVPPSPPGTPTPAPGTPTTPGPKPADTTPTPGPVAPVEPQIEAVQKQLTALQDQARTIRAAGGQITPQMQQQIAQLQQRLNQLLGLTTVPPTTTEPWPDVLPDTLPPGAMSMGGTPMTLLDALTTISQQTGVKFGVDLTVKPVPVSLPANVATMPLHMVLQRLLANTPYRFLVGPDNTYLIYKPVTQPVAGTQLRQALLDLSTAAEVPIVADPNVAGDVWVDIQDQPLETALELMLAGTPYVVKRMPNYYLVGDRAPTGPSFPDISETRLVRLNYSTAERVLTLLGPSFQPYVKAEPRDPGDPNDRGNTLMITAPQVIAERILQDILSADRRPRQVLLHARVVIMERGDLLNLGVKWGFPTMRAGQFMDDTLENVEDIGDSVMRGIQIGYTTTREFTDALMAAINLLEEQSQLNILASPQLLAQHGRESQLRQVTEEWFFMSAQSSEAFFFSQAELQKIESGTILTITPYIGDNNDITLKMAIEVSDSIPRGRGSDLPVVNRRIAKNSVTIQDGGTVALAGLTVNRARNKDSRVPGLGSIPVLEWLFRNKDSDKVNQEIAVFVTAQMVPENGVGVNVAGLPTGTPALTPTMADDGFREDLRNRLAGQNR